MIRIVTAARLERLEADAVAAGEHARQASTDANEAYGEHVRALYAVTDRAERAEADAFEVSGFLAAALAELSAAQQELLLKDVEIRGLREELEQARQAGPLFLLMRYGEPHTIYRSRADAYADTATHGAPADGWVPSDERPAREITWRIEAFIPEGSASGFRRVFQPAPEPIGGAA
ncbi:hypothetical protein ABZ446_14780 [Streptomyces sp. NPDC005813]|uniref:hypothetical protein n=1 Tax=Streptomyces sp. NPDC005813 TaxID=3155592 RepID=UPI0033C7C708